MNESLYIILYCFGGKLFHRNANDIGYHSITAGDESDLSIIEIIDENSKSGNEITESTVSCKNNFGVFNASMPVSTKGINILVISFLAKHLLQKYLFY